MEVYKLDEKSKPSQTPSHLHLDICRYCKNQDIGSTIALHLRKKKWKKNNGKILLKNSLNFQS